MECWTRLLTFSMQCDRSLQIFNIKPKPGYNSIRAFPPSCSICLSPIYLRLLEHLKDKRKSSTLSWDLAFVAWAPCWWQSQFPPMLTYNRYSKTLNLFDVGGGLARRAMRGTIPPKGKRNILKYLKTIWSSCKHGEVLLVSASIFF